MGAKFSMWSVIGDLAFARVEMTLDGFFSGRNRRSVTGRFYVIPAEAVRHHALKSFFYEHIPSLLCDGRLSTNLPSFAILAKVV
jgi:hypothetical protein